MSLTASNVYRYMSNCDNKYEVDELQAELRKHCLNYISEIYHEFAKIYQSLVLDKNYSTYDFTDIDKLIQDLKTSMIINPACCIYIGNIRNILNTIYDLIKQK